MINKNEIDLFYNYCKQTFSFDNLEHVANYNSLPICIIDCVYSLRSKYYSVTLPVVKRYASSYMNNDISLKTHTLHDFINNIDECGGCEFFAKNVLKNKQILSHRLKSEICYEIAYKLYNYAKINTLEDFKNYEDIDFITSILYSIKGFGDAGVNYLFMLAGDENRCKPDVHIHHCVRDALGYDISNEDCLTLFSETVKMFALDNIFLTVRGLDGIIWKYYQKGAMK